MGRDKSDAETRAPVTATPAARAAGRGDETVERIVAIAERLFAERGYQKTTVRDIADEAGVTHPLIYYHWGSKRGLLAAVLARTQARMRAVAGTTTGARESIEALVRENLAGSRLYITTLARALLDGMPADDWPGGFPGVRSALQVLGVDETVPGTARDFETRRLLAAALAMLFGWVLVEDDLLTMVGLPASERAEAREAFVSSFERVLRPALDALEA